jgi:hypothetical protein
MTTRLLRELRDLFGGLFRPRPGQGSAHAQAESDGQEASTEVPSDRSESPSGGQPFNVQSYIGSDIAQMQEEERPPEPTELVASVHFGGNDDRTYLLCTKKEASGGGESGWTLWQMGDDFDTGRPFCCRVASAYPYSDCDCEPAFVAEQLLTKVWEDEQDFGELPPHIATLYTAGLLSAQDLKRIFATVFA